MARFKHAGEDAAAGNHALLSADVLVVGGGPAGTWAAIKAAQVGADVVLADKGRCGSSGATASVGTGIWYVEDEPELREAAMASREALGGHLADRNWSVWRLWYALLKTGRHDPDESRGSRPDLWGYLATPHALHWRRRLACRDWCRC